MSENPTDIGALSYFKVNPDQNSKRYVIMLAICLHERDIKTFLDPEQCELLAEAKSLTRRRFVEGVLAATTTAAAGATVAGITNLIAGEPRTRYTNPMPNDPRMEHPGKILAERKINTAPRRTLGHVVQSLIGANATLFSWMGTGVMNRKREEAEDDHDERIRRYNGRISFQVKGYSNVTLS